MKKTLNVIFLIYKIMKCIYCDIDLLWSEPIGLYICPKCNKRFSKDLELVY